MASDRIIVRGAREHNLKNIDVEIPGTSSSSSPGCRGSGKSSLAFDTIYAEGQRRYVESLSAYARQFLEQMEKPEVDSIEGLSPGHLDRAEDHLEEPALDGRHGHRDLRLPARALRPRRHPALSRLRPRDLRADRAADGRSRADAAGGHAAAGPGAGHPRAQGRVQEALLRSAAAGLLAGARQRHRSASSARTSSSTSKRKHTIEVVVDRLIVRDNLGPRLADSLETALRLADGIVQVEPLVERGRTAAYGWSDITRTGGWGSRTRLPPSDQGRSPTCKLKRVVAKPQGTARLLRAAGLRRLRHLLPRGLAADVLVQQPVRRLPGVRRHRHAVTRSTPSGSCPTRRARSRPGALAPWAGRETTYFRQTLAALAKRHKFSLDEPWSKLPQERARRDPLRRRATAASRA